MQIDYVSDLHLDHCMQGGPFGNFPTMFSVSRYKNPESTILVVAGDTGENVSDTMDFLHAAKASYEYVIAVMGNHEKGSVPTYADNGVIVLDPHHNPSVDIEDVTFVGGNLPPGKDVGALLPAVRKVWKADRKLVVVSHYAPTQDLEGIFGYALASNSPDYALTNSLIEDLGDAVGPSVIIFGHLHLAVDVRYRGYHLLSNPRGYKSKRRDGSGFLGFANVSLSSGAVPAVLSE